MVSVTGDTMGAPFFCQYTRNICVLTARAACRDWFSPDYVCPTMERVGILGDGGKWICGMDVLQHRKDRGQPCVVYSFGVNQETTFEEELTNRTGCQVRPAYPPLWARRGSVWMGW